MTRKPARGCLGDTTKQFGKGRVQAIALDQTQCGFTPDRPATYNFFRHVRPSVAELPRPAGPGAIVISRTVA